ncbi:beta-hexosaminidase subunit alpha-like [Pecten maximus]|uniref:beta-hexosaminidase subunit alpha-like n=1 Tax=Pecten maximus TaxID=6579 RepID=UPI0014583392|nr:beta-hexosaminidase subunit alpha-like [Pecten maximus]
MWQDGFQKGVNIPKDTIIQVWKSKIHEIGTIIRKGYRVIFSTCWYLDHVRGYVHWQDFYNCEPNEIEAQEGIEILGGEACLWGEYISSEMVMSMLWPRGCAVAEKLWSSRKPRVLVDVSRRLSEQRCRMLRRGLDVGFANGPEYCVRRQAARSGQLSLQKVQQTFGQNEIESFLEKLRKSTNEPNVIYVSAIRDYTPIHLTSLALSMVGVLSITFMMLCRRKRR